MQTAGVPRRKAARHTSIYLIGTAGHPNYGDELITASWLRYYAKTLPGAKIWLDTPRPGQSAVLFGGIHPNLRCVDSLYHACWNAPSQDLSEVLDFGQRVIRDPGLIPREVTGIDNLADVDLIHIIGGGFLNGIWPEHLLLIAAAGAAAEVHGTRTAITGAGLTPFVAGSEQRLGQILSQFDVVDVRDNASAAALAPYVKHITLTSDDAFLDVGPQLFDRTRSENTALSLQSDLLEVSMEAVADYTVRTLQCWGVSEDPIALYEFLPPDDTAIVPMLRPHLPGLRVIPFSKLWRDGFPAVRGQRWISTRFHPHLMAAAQGATGLVIPTGTGYYRTKHESLIKLGSGWTLAPDLNDPVEVDPNPKIPFGGRLESIQQAKRAVAQRVVSLIREDR